jgi:hypothetical protein
MNKTIRITGITILATAAVGTVAALFLRDQIHRHQRNLFNPLTFRRLAALEHMARAEASVNNITLLRDFINWEPRKLLRNRARSIVNRMEREAETLPGAPLEQEA